jgi:DNA-directed RNA polymerase specialized sigma24 family protein
VRGSGKRSVRILTFDEIAAVLGVSQRTVMNDYNSAIDKLRAALDGDERRDETRRKEG